MLHHRKGTLPKSMFTHWHMALYYINACVVIITIILSQVYISKTHY